MSDTDDNFIRPTAPPLSHLQKRRRNRVHVDHRILITVIVVAVIAALVYLFAPEPSLNTVTVAGADQPTPSRDTVAPGNQGLTPFAASQKQLARERAQDALAVFVERQIKLEEELSIESWGQTELDAALKQARDADLAFADEDFPAALEGYETAAQSLQALLKQADERVETFLGKARQAVDRRQPDEAAAALAEAASLKPDAPDVQKLARRIELLPQIIGMLRTAKNQELAGKWQDALALYTEIERLDPQTAGLAERVAANRTQLEAQTVNEHITRGFDALSRSDFEGARSAFRAALKLDQGNDIALGGLQQVAQEFDLARIASLRNQAEQALQDENWADAEAAYDEILQMDANIQFAVDGKRLTAAHARTDKLLSSIVANPKRLSSQTLYLQAREIVDEAQSLSRPGPELTALIDETDRLLALYKDPVSLTLRSDDLTRITISNVGDLGTFTERTLSLRPGEYTIRGTANGCRDLYLKIEVVPGIEPLDLSCQERL